MLHKLHWQVQSQEVVSDQEVQYELYEPEGRLESLTFKTLLYCTKQDYQDICKITSGSVRFWNDMV